MATHDPTQRGEGVTITPDVSNAVSFALHDLNIMFRAIYDLADEIASAEFGHKLSAIRSMATLGGMKADRVSRTLGFEGFGNFAEERSATLLEVAR